METATKVDSPYAKLYQAAALGMAPPLTQVQPSVEVAVEVEPLAIVTKLDPP